MDAPPVVSKDVEDAENEDEEGGRPLGLEANSDHSASAETKDRDENTHEAPLALEDEAKEQEDEEHTTGQKEAETTSDQAVRLSKTERWRSLFLAVGFRD